MVFNMGRVTQIEAELQKLSAAELRQFREWLDAILEDELEFTPEFEAAVKQSEAEIATGDRPRVRKL